LHISMYLISISFLVCFIIDAVLDSCYKIPDGMHISFCCWRKPNLVLLSIDFFPLLVYKNDAALYTKT
jgi:hypothetical protein